MKREDIIRMAREAGIHVYPEFEEAFERFSELVRADEREVCAGLCDRFANRMMDAEECADAIRARGQV